VKLINVGWWETVAHAIFGITGANPIPELAEDVQCVAPLEGDFLVRPEWRYLKGERTFHTFFFWDAVVGERGFSGLWNPPDSGVLGIIDAILNGIVGLVPELAIGWYRGAAPPAIVDASSVINFSPETRLLRPPGSAPLHPASALRHWTGEATDAAFNAAFPDGFNGQFTHLPSANTQGTAFNPIVARHFWVVLQPGTFALLRDGVANNGAAAPNGTGGLSGLQCIFRERPLHKGTRA